MGRREECGTMGRREVWHDGQTGSVARWTDGKCSMMDRREECGTMDRREECGTMGRMEVWHDGQTGRVWHDGQTGSVWHDGQTQCTVAHCDWWLYNHCDSLAVLYSSLRASRLLDYPSDCTTADCWIIHLTVPQQTAGLPSDCTTADCWITI